MNQLAAGKPPNTLNFHVPFFNPASNTRIASLLRIANPNSELVHVQIEAWDAHATPAEDIIRLALEPYAAVLLSSQQLENGHPDVFEGRLGDGEGKWVFIVSDEQARPLEVMSLLRTRSGHLSNVSQ